MRYRNRRLGWLWHAAFTLVLGSQGFAALAQRQPEGSSKKELAAPLVEKARTEGTVRVLVGLNQSYRPDGELARAAAMEQREGILRSQETLMEELKGHSVTPLQSYKYLPYMAMEVTEDALRALVDSGAIATIEEDVLAEPTLSGTIPIVGADDAHALGFTGSGQTVAIRDTGIEGLHSFFGGRIVSEACYSNAGPSSTRRSLCPSGLRAQLGPGAAEATTGQCFDGASNLCRHGSHVAGIAAGNGSSFTGVAKNSNIIAIQVFTRFNSDSDCGSGRSPCVLSYRSDQIKGLERVYALRSAYSIAAANMSLGGGAYTSQAACDAANPSTKAAIDLLRSAGIATVISSGNGGFTNALGAPGCISSAISVGATDDADNVAGFSNSASFLDILAPGVRVTSSVPLGGFASFSGTSMAAPHVTGAWAVFKQLDPSATVPTVEAALKTSGTPVTDFRNGVTKPRLDLRTAITDPGSRTLTVTTSGDGAGTIVSGLPGISCGRDCSESYPHSTTVTLTAIPTGGSTFVSWTGACSGSAACVVTMTDDLAVDASFVAVEAPQYSYRVTVENLTGGQALTAPVVATHTGRVRLYRPRRRASAEIQALAENGDSAPLVTWLGADARVSDIATGATGALVPGSDPGGTLLGSSTNILIGADRRAKFLSMASKLVCTNDGFTGLNPNRTIIYDTSASSSFSKSV